MLLTTNNKLLYTIKMLKFNTPQIYPVITQQHCLNGSSIETLKQCLAADIKIVQLREKTSQLLHSLAREYRILTATTDTLLIINDHVDLALQVGADGVHLGQDDLSCKEAKKLAPNLIIGVSTHNLEEAQQAQSDGASYINIGPIYNTQTKTLPFPPLGIEQFQKIAQNISIPITVMGGIKAHHLPELIQAGAKTIAMVTEVTQAANINKKIQSLKTTIQASH